MAERVPGRATADWRPMRLARRDRIADDIYAVTLTCEQDAPLPEIAPGDHIEVQVPGGVRAYSLCNPPDAREGYQLAIHRSSAHGGAHYLCETLAVGSPLRVRGPRNLFALSPEHRRVVLIAGGIGITPIIAMAEHLARRDLDFQMHYCAPPRRRRVPGPARRRRLPASCALPLRRRSGSRPAGPGQAVRRPGRGPARLSVRSERDAGRCRDAGRAACAGRPSALRTFRRESSAGGDFRGGGRIRSAGGARRRRVEVPPDCSIAAALIRAGVDVPLSCEQGVCGMCMTRVIDGIPDHRDDVLSEAERASNGVILPCVSRAKSALLTLDL